MKQFESALKAAEAQLTKATAKRDKARADLTALDYEIPKLVSTINVLRQQLGREPIPVSATSVSLQANATASTEGYTLHDVESGMGSIPAPAPIQEPAFNVLDTMGDDKEWT